MRGIADHTSSPGIGPPSPSRCARSALRLGVSDPELLELEEPLELDEPDDDEELEDELDDDEEEEEDEDEDVLELLELNPPDPVVGAAGESPHAAVNPAAAMKVPCDRSIRKSRRACRVTSC